MKIVVVLPNNIKYIGVYLKDIDSHICTVASGDALTPPPPPESEKLLQKTGFIFHGYPLEEVEILEIYSKNFEKVNFPLRFCSENLKIFLKFFMRFTSFGP